MMRRRWAAVVFLALVGFAVAQTPAPKPANPQSKVKSLQSDLKEIQAEKNKARRELGAVRTKIRVVKGTLSDVNNRIEKIEDELVATGRQLTETRAEQKRLAEELEVLGVRLKSRTEEARRRLRVMRTRGQASLLSALTGSRNMGELASRRYLFERVAKKDRELFDEVKELQAKVTQRKQRQDATVKHVASLLNRQKSQQHDLKESKADQQHLMVQLRGKEGDLKKLIAQLDAEENAIEATIASFMRKPENTAGLTKPSGRLLMPISGGRLGSGFGMRMHPILKYKRMHKGVDIGARSGTPILAAADGVVITSTAMRGYGKVIVLAHGGGVSTLYAHCSALLKGNGARVKRGEMIARVGSTGLSTGPHLHFEVHVNGKAVNPRSWL